LTRSSSEIVFRKGLVLEETQKSGFSRDLKLLISLGLFGLDSVSRRVRLLAGKKCRPDCVILYYHSVRPEQRQRFAQQMDLLLQLTRPVRLDVDLPLDPGSRYSGVSFDDGFVNVLENALPELVKRNIPATIFVAAKGLGAVPNYWPPSACYERTQRVLTEEELRRLPENLITIGSHTVTHPFLPSLEQEEARRELYESRIGLERLLKRKVTLFSFPFGGFNGHLVQWAREAGYDRVFTTLPKIAFATAGEFAIGRVPVEPSDRPLEFRLKLLGAYRWLPYAFAVKGFLFSTFLMKRWRRHYGINLFEKKTL
jgi:peptidoglycan/xylan/chitin deacetylase (PgdA/CDA1 family)